MVVVVGCVCVVGGQWGSGGDRGAVVVGEKNGLDSDPDSDPDLPRCSTGCLCLSRCVEVEFINAASSSLEMLYANPLRSASASSRLIR